MKKSLRIFISATWEDTKPEREAVERALRRREIPFESMSNWGSQDMTPTAASLKKLAGCNIYVGIIGFKYGRVTEEEYNYALDKKIKRLIYVKDDNVQVSVKFTEQDDPEKLRKLNEFKKRLKSDLTYTTYRNEGELAERVLQDILDQTSEAITKIEQPDDRDTILSLQRKWLHAQGMNLNPFQYISAQTETRLSDYYVDFPELQVLNLYEDTSSYLIFGPSGSGKSALSRMIAEKCYPKQESSSTLAIHLNIEFWQEIWKKIKAQGISPDIYIEQILRISKEEIKKSGSSSGEVLDEIEKIIKNINTRTSEETTAYRKFLRDTIRAIEPLGLEAIVCLVDEMSEISGVGGDREQVLPIIAPLMSALFRDAEGLRFIFFLPLEFEEAMIAQRNVFHPASFQSKHIDWDKKLLKGLLSQRMKVASNRRFDRVSEICESDLRLIDEYLTEKTISDNNPRAVLRLADMLIKKHCQTDSVSGMIDLRTWVVVRKVWDEQERKLVIGMIDFDTNGFHIKDGSIYFRTLRIKLKPEHERLLRVLIYAQGDVCTKEELIIEMWPDEVSPRDKHNLQVEMGRLKQELREQGVKGDWIQNIRGIGYQLIPPSPVRTRHSGKK